MHFLPTARCLQIRLSESWHHVDWQTDPRFEGSLHLHFQGQEVQKAVREVSDRILQYIRNYLQVNTAWYPEHFKLQQHGSDSLNIHLR